MSAAKGDGYEAPSFRLAYLDPARRTLVRAAMSERTIAVTWGPWGGVWFTGRRGLIWRLCLGFVAITYVPAEMTQILNAWLDAEEKR